MPRLGLTSSASTPDSQKALKSISFKPTQVSGLVIWFDFTDSSSIYTDAGSTNVSAGNEKIYRVDNKAYTKQNNSTDAIGKFVEQDTSNQRPVYTKAGKQNNAYAQTGDSNVGTTYGLNVGEGLHASSDPDVTTDTLSDSSIALKRSTWFVVVACAATSIASEGVIFEIQNENQDVFRIHQNATTNNIGSQTYQVAARTTDTTDSGVTSTTDTEIWTFHYGNTINAGKIYKNGDESNGITNGTIQNITFDMSIDNAHVDIGVCNNHSVLGAKDFVGKVHEVLGYNGGLSDANRHDVEDYLKFKYNL